MLVRKRLTGRVDVRTGWWGRQIVTVEEVVEHSMYRQVPPRPGVDRIQWDNRISAEMEGSWSTATRRWRDARVHEITSLLWHLVATQRLERLRENKNVGVRGRS